MKTKLAIAAIIVPVAVAGTMTLHPGIAHAETPLSKLKHSLLQKGTYTIDGAHTSVGFEINHLGLANVQGRFTKNTGKLNVDPTDVTNSSIEVNIDATSVDTAIAPRDTHLRSPDFFDVAKYPELTFKSTKIRKLKDGYLAEGNLTIKGTTKAIQIPFKTFGPITDPWGGTRVGVIAEPVKINRQAFGVAYDQKLPDGTPAVGNDVTIKLSLEATLDK